MLETPISRSHAAGQSNLTHLKPILNLPQLTGLNKLTSRITVYIRTWHTLCSEINHRFHLLELEKIIIIIQAEIEKIWLDEKDPWTGFRRTRRGEIEFRIGKPVAMLGEHLILFNAMKTVEQPTANAMDTKLEPFGLVL
jgi:hypothetical protein